MNFKPVRFWITSILILTALLEGCVRITVSEAEELAAERFEPQPGYGNLYIVREKTFIGMLADIELYITGQHIGPINIGTYHLLELRPGRYNIEAYANKALRKKTGINLEIVEGENHFIQAEPVGGFVPKASLEIIDAVSGREMVLKGSRLITKDVDL